jgi:hypothetical protein
VAAKFLSSVATSGTSGACESNTSGTLQPPSAQPDVLAEACKKIHRDAAELSARFKAEAGRINYVTPTTYLELLTMFISLLLRRRGAVTKQKKRYSVRFHLFLTFVVSGLGTSVHHCEMFFT